MTHSDQQSVVEARLGDFCGELAKPGLLPVPQDPRSMGASLHVGGLIILQPLCQGHEYTL